MRTETVTPSDSLTDACQAFLDDIGVWTQDCMGSYGHLPPTDVHDQATYTTGWMPYIQISGDKGPLRFMKQVRDDIARHFHQQNQWRHGYWRMHEAHHGTEHFELFLGTLSQLDPQDGETLAQVVDAAEHFGNWDESVPPWFDWETNLYSSIWFGTDGIKIEPGSTINMPDHFRCANICLQAYAATHEPRYLALPRQMLGRWAAVINQGEQWPLGLDQTGPLYDLGSELDDYYSSFAGQAGDLNQQVDRAENFLASNGVDAFLSLWQLTEEPAFLQAAERLLAVLATQLADPDAGPAADALLRYRRLTGQDRYDQTILAAVDTLEPESIRTLSIEPEVARSQRPVGIGKRQDMPAWYENGQPRRCNPILLAAAAQIKQDQALATQAVDLARTYFELARAVYPDGRDHGCSARSVSAISRGHGRDNNAGMITAVLQPLYAAFLENRS